MLTAICTWLIAEYIDNMPKKPTVTIITYEVESTPTSQPKLICKSMNLKCRGCSHCLFHEHSKDCEPTNPKKCKYGNATICR